MTVKPNGRPRTSVTTTDMVADFDSIVTQLRDMLDSLQNRVTTLTNDLQVAAEVSTKVATLLEPDELLPELVETVKERFGLYHAHVYLLDEVGQQLNLAAGAGEAGRKMLERGHSISMNSGQSLVARAARERQAVLVEDVTVQPDFLPNDLLPYTRSEMAVPMITGDRVIGVLDVQSEHIGRFTDVDRQVKTTLADQLAVAIQNASVFYERNLAEERETLAYEIGQQLNTLQEPQELLQFAVDRLASSLNYYHAHVYLFEPNTERLIVTAGLGEAGREMREAGHSIDYHAEQSLVATAARTFEPVLVEDVTANPNHLPNPLIPDTLSEVAIPLYLGSNLLGVLDVQASSRNAFDNSEIRLLNIIANQLSVSLSNAQRLEQTLLRLRDIQIANEAAQTITESSDVESMMRDILQLVTSAFGNDTTIYATLDNNTWYGVVGINVPDDIMQTIEDKYEAWPHAVDALESRDVITVDNAYEYDKFPMEYVDRMGLKSVAVLPIIGHVGAIGVIFFNFTTSYHTFTDDEINLMRGLSRQIATGIESKRLEVANERLSLLVNTSDQFVAYARITDSEVVYLNEGGAQLLGYDSADELIGFQISDFHPAENAQAVIEQGLPVVMEGHIWRYENYLRHKDGNFIPVDQTLFLLNDEQGQPFALATIMQDIRERRAAEEDRNRIFNLSSDMIGAANFEGYFTELNPAWETILGWSLEELMATPFLDFVHPDDVQMTISEASKISSGVTSLQFTNRYRTRDGSYRWIAWNATPDVERGLNYFVARDVTEERRQAAIIEQRAEQLRLVSEIGTTITQILDPETLLPEVAQLVTTAFDLYHIHIWMADDSGENLTVFAGNGRAPCHHVDERFTVNVNDEQSLVTRAALDRKRHVVNDLDADPDITPTALLPDTKSQMVFPLVVGGDFLGVIDIHSDEVGGFTQEDVLIQGTMTTQVAIALENARSFQQSQVRARKMATVAEIGASITQMIDPERLLPEVTRLVTEAFDLYHIHIWMADVRGEHLSVYAGDGRAPCHHVTDRYTITIGAEDNLVNRAALNRELQVVNDLDADPDVNPTAFLPDTRSQMTIPLIVSHDLLGVMDIHADRVNGFNEEDIVVQSTMATQVAIALENARSFQQSQRRAQKMALVADITTQTANTLDVNELLLSVANVTKERLGLYHAHIYLLNDAKDTLLLAAGAGEPGRLMVTRGHQIALDHPNSIVAEAARTGDGVIANNVSEAPSFLPNPLLPETQSEMAIPMIYNREVVGVMDVQASELDYFTEDDVSVQTVLAGQIAVSIINARTFEREQITRRENERRARELETVAQVSAAASTIMDVEELLLGVTNLTKAAFDLYHAHVYLYDEENHQLELVAGAGEPGRIMKEHGHRISYEHPTSIVARAAREREGMIVNDVTASETFMPNPMLPDTRAELALPMLVGDQLIGVLDVQSELAERFTTEDVRVKSTLASQVAVAVQNALAFEQTQRMAEIERNAAERLREVDRLKNEFLASMSHELRTPLNSIIGYSEVLMDGGDGDLNEDAYEDVEIIHTSGRHLLAIINDILDLAKIEAQQMHLRREPVDMVQIMRDIIKTNQVLIKDSIELILDTEFDELIVPADEQRIRQVMINLFSNAAKFTEQGSITLSLRMIDDFTARIAVEDSGIGISPEGLAIVFDRFRQVDSSTTRKKGGTGLGLNITRHLIQMHGGDIHVESEVGVGTTFWFTLPVVINEDESEQTESELA